MAGFGIDAKTGSLTPINAQPSGGQGPCHLAVDATGANVLVANYGNGSVSVLPVAADGRLSAPAVVIQHKGSSVDRRRQEGPHAHEVVLDAANRLAVVPDLGLDHLQLYDFDAGKHALTAHDPAFATVAPVRDRAISLFIQTGSTPT